MGFSIENDTAPKYWLNTIYFYLTEDCNLRCRHCWISPRYNSGKISSSYLPFELYCSIINESKPLGLSTVKLTGGEPLLHPQIEEIIDFTREQGLMLTIETNGTLCTKELAIKIASCKNSHISVSLDGTDAETHEWVRGVNGCFDQALDGIRNLVSAGLKPQIIMTIMRHNKDQMESMVKLAESLGVGSIKFNIVQPTARGKKITESGDTLSIEELVEIGKWSENVLAASSNIKLFFSHPPAFRPMGKMFGERGNGCGICGIKGIIGVLADGSYALCGIGESIPELIFGKAPIDRLDDVWNKNKMLHDIRTNLPDHLEGVCLNCMMKNVCLGSCIAQNYYRSKNLWAPYWYCEEAYQKGLFPLTRILPK